MPFLCCFASPSSSAGHTDKGRLTCGGHLKGVSLQPLTTQFIIQDLKKVVKGYHLRLKGSESQTSLKSVARPLKRQSSSTSRFWPRAACILLHLHTKTWFETVEHAGDTSGDKLDHTSPANKALGQTTDTQTWIAGGTVHSFIPVVGVSSAQFQSRVDACTDPGAILREVAAINASPASGSHTSSTQVGGPSLCCNGHVPVLGDAPVYEIKLHVVCFTLQTRDACCSVCGTGYTRAAHFVSGLLGLCGATTFAAG